MKVGDTFSSFEELELCLRKHKEENFVDFYINDCRTLANAKKSCPKKVENVSEELKYYYVKYQCVHGGKFKRKKTNTGARETSTLKQGCEAFMYINIDDKTQKLVISKMSSEHNHEISKELFRNLPSQRRLAPDMKQEVLELLNLKANKKLIQEKVQKATGGIITLRDISNIAATGKEKSHNNIEEVVDSLQTKHNCTVEICADNDKNLLGIFIQDDEMKKSFDAFPEFVCADSTYKLLDLKIPVFVLLVEDGNGQSEVVAIGLLVHESESVLTWFFETFKKLNLACSQIKVIMSDKDLTERAVIKKVLPNIKLRICLFHTLRSFNREITCERMGITPSQRDLTKEMFQKICYSSNVDEYNKLYEQMKSLLPPKVITYFNTNWHPIRAEWSAAAGYNVDTFLNRTNNRLESFNAKMKSVITKFSSLEEFTEKLFVLLKCIRTERNGCAARLLQKVPTKQFSNADESKYYSFLTLYSFKFLQKQLNAANDPENSTTDNKYDVTDKTCTCLFHKSMLLPCRHIFIHRKKFNLPLFSSDLCDKRWSRDYYIKKHRICQEKENMSLISNIIEPDQLAEISIVPHQKILTTHQKFRKASVLTSKIATLVSENSNIHFERKMSLLGRLLDCWSQGKEVEITEVTDNSNFEAEILGTNTDETQIFATPMEIDSQTEMNRTSEPNTDELKISETPKNNVFHSTEDVSACENSTASNNKNVEKKNYPQSLEIDSAECVNYSNNNFSLPNTICETKNDCRNYSSVMLTEVLENKSNPSFLSNNVIEGKEEILPSAISLKDIKVPSKIVMRGRPKGITLTTIGLPKKRARAHKLVAFADKHYREKEDILLSWVIDKDVLEKIKKDNHIITESEIECRPEKIHSGILDTNVDVNTIRKYFSSEGWIMLQSVLEIKRKTCVWVCPICETGTSNNRSVACKSCLLWFHFKCAGITAEPKRKKWFCTTCYSTF